MSKKVCVTGGTGFLGYNLTRTMVKRGWDVSALHRKGSDVTGLRALNVNLIECDLACLTSVLDNMPLHIDYLFHVAGNTSYSPADEIQIFIDNVVITNNLLIAASKIEKVRFIHTSTVDAFGWHEAEVSEAVTSNAMTVPVQYVQTKYMAECLVKKAHLNGLDVVILNPANIIGPFDRSNWSKMFLVIQKQSVHFNFPGAGEFNHVEDVANAHISAARKGRNGENYLLGGTFVTYKQLSRMMASKLGLTVPEFVPPKQLLHCLGFLLNAYTRVTGKKSVISHEEIRFLTRSFKFNSQKAKLELGYQISPIENCIDDCYEWLIKEKLI